MFRGGPTDVICPKLLLVIVVAGLLKLV